MFFSVSGSFLLPKIKKKTTKSHAAKVRDLDVAVLLCHITTFESKLFLLALGLVFVARGLVNFKHLFPLGLTVAVSKDQLNVMAARKPGQKSKEKPKGEG